MGLRILAVLLVAATLFPVAAFADGEPGTAAEAEAYAQREANSPEAAAFAGGGALEVVLILLLIGAIGFLIWYLVYYQHQ